MYLVKAEANQIEKIVAMPVRAFETDVNVLFQKSNHKIWLCFEIANRKDWSCVTQ